MKFFTRSAKNGKANLYIRIARPKLGFQFWVNTKIIVDVTEWQKAEKSNKAMLKYFATPQGEKVQKLMQEVEGKVKELFTSGVIKSASDKDLIERTISAIVNHDANVAIAEEKKREKEEEKRKKSQILTYFDSFIVGMEKGETRQRGSKTYKASSVEVWRRFEKYLKFYTPATMTFNEINKKFANGFVIYLEKSGLMAETVNKYIACYRRLCNAAALDEVNTNLVSVKVWVEKTIDDSERRSEIALTDEEVNAIYDMELDGIRDEVRDVFLLGVFSGQRFSDYSTLTRENFKVTKNGVNVITLVQKKTNTEVYIPILDERVLEICAKYNYNFPKIEKRTMNRYIKEIAHDLSEFVPSLGEWSRTRLTMQERAKETRYMELRDGISKGKKYDGETMKQYREMAQYNKEHESGDYLFKRDFSGAVIRQKWEMVCSHTARRTCITALYDSDLLDLRDIQSISGHKTLANTEKYIKRGSVKQAERIAEKMGSAKIVKMKRQA